MCIRDRLWRLSLFLRSLQKKQGNFIVKVKSIHLPFHWALRSILFWLMTVHSLCTVSYTHLDVYKRQVVNLLSCKFNDITKAGNIIRMFHRNSPNLQSLCGKPVSYTHLDVYKRQPPRDSKAWEKEYNRRTSVERSKKREKEDYKLEDGRHRSTKMWYCRLYGIMMLQHLDAWEMPSVGYQAF